MSLLGNSAYHVILNKIDKNGHPDKMMFPTNTVEDVIVTEDGNTLTDFVSAIPDGTRVAAIVPASDVLITEAIPTKAMNSILGIPNTPPAT